MMKALRLGGRMPLVALALLGATTASAGTNLVHNGSFEGSDALAGWTIGGTASDHYLPVAIAYNQASGYPTGAQGEAIPVDDAVSADPDGAGSNAVYFVSDEAKNLSLYQYVHLTPGSYDIGFDSYDSFNGREQPHDADFTAQIAGVSLASFDLASVAAGTWTAHTGEALITTAGDYLVSFTFNTPDTPADPDPANPGGEYNAKDVLIDRVFVVSAADGGGTPIAAVPEPASWALIIGGIGWAGGMMRRAARRSEEDFTRRVRALARS